MPRNWTDEQSAAIEERSHTLLLSAAAGSGKTATLTERLIRMITDTEHPQSISQMLIVTFTRAAAAELRERIGAALSEALANDPENRHLSEQLLLLPSARIRTIDSFCQDLVRGHTDLLDIPASFRIADEAEGALMAERLMNEVVDDSYSGLYAPEGLDIPLCAECLVGPKNEQSLCAVLLSLYRKVCGFQEGVELLKRDSKERVHALSTPFFDTKWGKQMAHLVKDEATDLLTAYRTALEKADIDMDVEPSVFLTNYRPAIVYDLAFWEELTVQIPNGYGAVRRHLMSYAPPPLGRARSKQKQELTEAESQLKEMRLWVDKKRKSLLDGFFAWEEDKLPKALSQSGRVEYTLYLLLFEFERRFREEKKRRGLCDYDDLEHFALSLLLKDGVRTPLAEELSQSFTAVCIDEYQDVNEIQHLIFEAIATEDDRFMVGDIKQSIYGFRGAQPSIFAALRRSLPAEPKGRVLYLTRNFRSLPPVIDLCNLVFDFLFDSFGESIGYVPEDRLQAARQPAEGGEPLQKPVFTLLVAQDTPEEEGDADPDPAEQDNAPTPESRAVARQIAALLQNGRLQNGEKVMPHDIAILLRKGSSIATYTAALKELHIPVLAEDRTSFFYRPEILLALCLLHTVNNPLRDVYLSGLLRSPLYGFSLEELILIRRHGDEQVGECPLYEALCLYQKAHPDFEKGRFFLTELATFRDMAEGMAADKLIRYLYDKTGLLLLADAQQKKDLLFLLNCAREYEAESFHGLFRFLCHVNELMRNGRQIGGKRTVGQAESVSIMTIHHSKGLEYPICFLPECSTPMRRTNRDPLEFDQLLGVGHILRDDSGLGALENPIHLTLKANALARETEEEVRVLYVALTRAKEQLYLFARPGRKKAQTLLKDAAMLRNFANRTILSGAANYSEWLLAALGLPSGVLETGEWEHPLFHFRIEALPSESAAQPEESPDAAPAFEEEEMPDANTLAAIFQKRFSFVYPHKAATRLPGKLSVSRLYPTLLDEKQEPASLPEPLPVPEEQDTEEDTSYTLPIFLSGEEPDPAAKAGTATHVFLQFCRLNSLLFETTGSVCMPVKGECSSPGGVCYSSFDAHGGVCSHSDEVSSMIDKRLSYGQNPDFLPAEKNGKNAISEEVARERVQKELERLVREGFMTELDAKRVRQKELVAFVRSSLAARIASASKIQREFRFNAYLPATAFTQQQKELYEGEELFVQGVIDLLLFDKEGDITLVDYKTDRIPFSIRGDKEKENAFLTERHHLQLCYYAMAVKRIFGRWPTLLLYSLALGREIPVALDENAV